MKGQRQLLSSASDNWATPVDTFAQLSSMFGPFDLDPCADERNSTCPKYFDESINGLVQPWSGRVYMNPPYGRDIGRWVSKAWLEVQQGNVEVAVCLLPARTDTRWWHKYCMRGEIWFVKGRLKFGGSPSSATFPSVVVVFRKTEGAGLNAGEMHKGLR